MLRFVLVILALAVYGAYSLIGSFAGSGDQGAAVEVSQQAASGGFSLSGAAEMAVSAATRTAGMELAPLPAEGCSESMMAPAKVEQLVMSLAEPQRTALATMLSASSSVWTAQLYRGEKGIGLCLPAHEKLVVLPASVNAAVDQLGDVVATLPQPGAIK